MTNPLKKFRRELRVAAIAFAIALFAGTVYLELRFAVFRASPRVDLAGLAEDPSTSIVVVINPELAMDQLRPLLNERAGFAVPNWIVRRILPYAVTIVTASDYDNAKVDLTVFLNPRRFGPPIQREVNAIGLQSSVPEIQWAPEGLIERGPGVFSVSGSVPMEPEAQEAAWYLWNQSFKPSAIPFQGAHFIEVVMDNRDGGAYLAVASILHAFDIDLDEGETDISLSSLKFVTKARMSIDVTPTDLLLFRLAIEVRPDAVNRLGVINLKVGIEELLAEWSERLFTEHEIVLEGKNEWNENVMLFQYRLKGASKALRLAIDGELFK